jgi:hypothetical protein
MDCAEEQRQRWNGAASARPRPTSTTTPRRRSKRQSSATRHSSGPSRDGIRHRTCRSMRRTLRMYFHLDARTDDLVRSELSLAEARRRARLEFGDSVTLRLSGFEGGRHLLLDHHYRVEVVRPICAHRLAEQARRDGAERSKRRRVHKCPGRAAKRLRFE